MFLSTPPLEVERVLKSSDGTEIFARATGRPENPSIVFIHGFAFSGHVFDELSKDRKLLDQYYLVSYDMRGHGRSGKPKRREDHTSALYAADFVAVVKAFDLDSPILVGWSLGGMIKCKRDGGYQERIIASVACDVCAHLPGAISGIVTVSGMPYIGNTMVDSVTAPGASEIISGLLSTDDVVLSTAAKLAFVDANFTDPSRVPVSVKWSWLGAVS